MLPLGRVRYSEWAAMLLLAVTILWKGGKSLESTWLVAGFGVYVSLQHWFGHRFAKRDAERQLEIRQGLTSVRSEIPFTLWAVALLYSVWSSLSYALSETLNYGLDEALRSTGFMLLFLWIARQQIERNSESVLQRFPAVITATALVAALIGVAVYTLQPVDRFVGTFFDARFHTDYWPNAWAEFLLLACPMALFTAWKQEHSGKRMLLYSLLGFLLATLLLSYSRGAIIAFVAQCIIMATLSLALAYRDIRYRRTAGVIARRMLRVAACVGVIAVLLFIGINQLRAMRFDVASVVQKATFTAAEGRSSIDERAQFWGQAQEFALERPLFGWGPYSFRFVQPAVMTSVLATADHPHNVLLKLSMERGYPVALLFACIYGAVTGIAMLSFFTVRKAFSPLNDMFTIACITAITGVLLHNVIDYNLQFVGISMSIIMCLGALVAPAAPVLNDPMLSFRRWRVRKNLIRAEVVLAFLTLFVLLWEGTFLVTSSIGRHAAAAGDTHNALYWFNLSHGELFNRDLHLSEAQLHMDVGNFAEAERALRRYEARNEYDPRLWRLHAELSMQKGDAQQAFAYAQKAYERGRYTDAGILRILLETARRAEQTPIILKRKMELDALFSAYADAIESNTHFIALSGNVEELQTIARMLAQMYPSDAQRYKAIARNALAHARTERQQYEARVPGILW